MDFNFNYLAMLSDIAPKEPPISPLLRLHLELVGLMDAGWMLGAQLGIRTLCSLMQLTAVDVDLCCMRLACAGFGPGHAAALRGLRNLAGGVELQPQHCEGFLSEPVPAEPVPAEHSTTAKLLSKVDEVRALVVAVQTTVLQELLVTGPFQGSNMVVQEMLSTMTALETLRDEAAKGERPTQECSQIEKMAALLLESCEEARTSLALRSTDEATAKLQTKQILDVRNASTELLVLCCSRPLDADDLSRKGILESLRNRLSAACGCDLRDDQHQHLWSRLGKAKYHVFTPGKQWGGKKRHSAADGTAAMAAQEEAVPDLAEEEAVPDLAEEEALPGLTEEEEAALRTVLAPDGSDEEEDLAPEFSEEDPASFWAI